MLGRKREGPDLDERLRALQSAVDAADGLVADAELASARALLRRAGERLGHGIEHTVVALAGATGSGKSSLFNALAEAELSVVAARRPTTSTTHSCAWGRDASALLDWLGVDRRHAIPDPNGPDGLVLLDLPDHDSTAAEHRREVDRIVAIADLVVWVVDPQKYADAAIHDQYLRPLAGHGGVLLVALNQSDRLDAEQLEACRRDLGRLLVDDGLPDVAVVTTSTRTPGGTEPLKHALGQRLQARHLAVERLEADLTAVAANLARLCGDSPTIDRPLRDGVVDTLLDAAGVELVTSAVATSFRSRSIASTGWPATRWLRKARPDPLRRLHLGAGRPSDPVSAARTSLPKPTSVTSARAETAVKAMVDGASASLRGVWAEAARREVAVHAPTLATRLDAAVATTDLGMEKAPRWWKSLGVLQTLLFVVTLTGLIWLTALFVLSYLRLDVPTPEVARLPLPTLLVGGGVLGGLLVAVLGRRMAGVGGRRRARRARQRLGEAVERVAEVEVFAPLERVLARHTLFCEAVSSCSGPASLRGGRRGNS